MNNEQIARGPVLSIIAELNKRDAEIERLRGEIVVAEQVGGKLMEEREQLGYEIERLHEEVVANAGAFGKLHRTIGEQEGEIKRLHEEQTRADWRAADLQRLNTEKAQEIERLRETYKTDLAETLAEKVKLEAEIERLRMELTKVGNGSYNPALVIAEQQAEIERLRQENALLTKGWQPATPTALRDEIERLRGLLRECLPMLIVDLYENDGAGRKLAKRVREALGE